MLKYCKDEQFRPVNLFNNMYFQDYDQLVAEILNLHERTISVLPSFKKFTAQIREQSNGTSVDEGIRIPPNENLQFEVLAGILTHMFSD